MTLRSPLGRFSFGMFTISLTIVILFLIVTRIAVFRDAWGGDDRPLSNVTGVSLSPGTANFADSGFLAVALIWRPTIGSGCRHIVDILVNEHMRLTGSVSRPVRSRRCQRS